MKRMIQSNSSFPERMEKHAKASWFDLSFNHKTTLSMGMLIPLATKEVYPGEKVRLQNELRLKFAQMYLPIMHQVYYTCDWYYVTYDQLWPRTYAVDNWTGWQSFIKQDPINGTVGFPTFDYARADAIFTDGILNYMGFNAPPAAGTLISTVENLNALPVSAYGKIYDEYYRNDQIQTPIWFPLEEGDNTAAILTMVPDLRVLRRNWPRDYYTSATPTPQQGENILIPSFATDPDGDYVAQKILNLDGTAAAAANLSAGVNSGETVLQQSGIGPVVLQLSSTIRDFRYAAQMTEYLERALRAGDRYVDFVQRNFGYNPNPLYIDRPVWIGGYTGNVIVSDVMATAEVGAYSVGQYTGNAQARDNTPVFEYSVPDYGVIICLMTVYPKASYYSGLETMWTRTEKMSYMWEQFALIGDQPIRNKEVWFSWYSADIAWNNEIFGYLPQYTQFKYSNDIVSGQMRTLWESFHLGRKFTGAGEVILNDDFIKCVPDIGRVFNVDAEAGEHECFVHAYNSIQILRKLPINGLPSL